MEKHGLEELAELVSARADFEVYKEAVREVGAQDRHYFRAVDTIIKEELEKRARPLKRKRKLLQRIYDFMERDYSRSADWVRGCAWGVGGIALVGALSGSPFALFYGVFSAWYGVEGAEHRSRFAREMIGPKISALKTQEESIEREGESSYGKVHPAESAYRLGIELDYKEVVRRALQFEEDDSQKEESKLMKSEERQLCLGSLPLLIPEGYFADGKSDDHLARVYRQEYGESMSQPQVGVEEFIDRIAHCLEAELKPVEARPDIYLNLR